MNKAAADASRCLSLLALAQARPGSTPVELARAAHVPLRQVYRDLFGTLLLCGVPPYLPHQFVTCVLENGRVRTAFAEHLTRPVALSHIEVAALRAATEAATPDASAEALKDLFKKIEATMPARSRKRWRRLERSLVFDRPAEAAGAAFATFVEAIRTRRIARFDYLPLGRRTKSRRTAEPFGIFERSGSWYLAARDVDDGKVRSFRVDRAGAVEITKDSFEFPTEFSLEAFAAAPAPERGVDAAIRLGPDSERAITDAGYVVGKRGRKGGPVVWRTRCADVDAFACFLLNLGAFDFEVIEPAALRRRIVEIVEAAAAAHDGAVKAPSSKVNTRTRGRARS